MTKHLAMTFGFCDATATLRLLSKAHRETVDSLSTRVLLRLNEHTTWPDNQENLIDQASVRRLLQRFPRLQCVILESCLKKTESVASDGIGVAHLACLIGPLPAVPPPPLSASPPLPPPQPAPTGAEGSDGEGAAAGSPPTGASDSPSGSGAAAAGDGGADSRQRNDKGNDMGSDSSDDDGASSSGGDGPPAPHAGVVVESRGYIRLSLRRLLSDADDIDDARREYDELLLRYQNRVNEYWTRGYCRMSEDYDEEEEEGGGGSTEGDGAGDGEDIERLRTPSVASSWRSVYDEDGCGAPNSPPPYDGPRRRERSFPRRMRRVEIEPAEMHPMGHWKGPQYVTAFSKELRRIRRVVRRIETAALVFDDSHETLDIPRSFFLKRDPAGAAAEEEEDEDDRHAWEDEERDRTNVTLKARKPPAAAGNRCRPLPRSITALEARAQPRPVSGLSGRIWRLRLVYDDIRISSITPQPAGSPPGHARPERDISPC